MVMPACPGNGLGVGFGAGSALVSVEGAFGRVHEVGWPAEPDDLPVEMVEPGSQHGGCVSSRVDGDEDDGDSLRQGWRQGASRGCEVGHCCWADVLAVGEAEEEGGGLLGGKFIEPDRVVARVSENDVGQPQRRIHQGSVEAILVLFHHSCGTSRLVTGGLRAARHQNTRRDQSRDEHEGDAALPRARCCVHNGVCQFAMRTCKSAIMDAQRPVTCMTPTTIRSTPPTCITVWAWRRATPKTLKARWTPRAANKNGSPRPKL